MKAKTDQPLIFIVDDDEAFTRLVARELNKAEYKKIEVYANGTLMMDNLVKKPDIVFLDYTLEPEMNGLDVLKKIKETDKGIYVIMFTAAEKIELAIDSLRLGAYDYIIKNENAFVKIVNRIKKIIKEKHLFEQSR